ncbi:MAG: DNA replication complex GINS family protein [Candidatus Altiarchaeota archaeon]|nr:DNA replication complex GINS family protein [Candidatus Altiarchaeota archaeon]
MALNYSELQGIYRSEKTSAALHKVPNNFYSELSELLSKVDPEYRESTSKLAEEIYLMRIGKIMRLVLRRGDATPPMNMTPPEKEVYGEFTSTLSRHRERILGIGGREEKTEEKREVEDYDKVAVRIIASIPAIIGSDMKHYGPFREDEEVKLPKATARILVGQGVAEEVSG